MEHKHIDVDLRGQAFRFFHLFSRFEFALKENDYPRYRHPDSPAIPGWREFAKERYAAYLLSPRWRN